MDAMVIGFGTRVVIHGSFGAIRQIEIRQDAAGPKL